MPQNFATDVKTCPKCSDTMTKVDVVGAIPKSIGLKVRSVSDPSPAISISDVLPVELYRCPGCKFVELYAY